MRSQSSTNVPPASARTLSFVWTAPPAASKLQRLRIAPPSAPARRGGVVTEPKSQGRNGPPPAQPAGTRFAPGSGRSLNGAAARPLDGVEQVVVGFLGVLRDALLILRRVRVLGPCAQEHERLAH